MKPIEMSVIQTSILHNINYSTNTVISV